MKFLETPILKIICGLLLLEMLISCRGRKDFTFEVVCVTIENPAVCLALYLTGVHFRDEIQHVGDVTEQRIKCQPIRTR